MRRFSKKIIALTIVLSLFLSLGFNLFIFKPKTARALDGGAGWAGNIKDFVLDAVSSVISDVMLKRLEKNIQDWGMGKKSSIKLPFGIEDFKDYFDEFLNIASAKFLDEFKNTKLCTGLNFALGNAPNINLRTLRSNLRSVGRFSRTFGTAYIDQPTYAKANACTLEKVINNVESFIKRPRISIFGWDAWKALNSPQNNIYGAFFSALDRKTQIAAREVMNASQQATAGGGYRNQTTTTANSRDKCSQDCRAGTNLPACNQSTLTCDQQYPNVGPIPFEPGDAERYALYQQCLQREQGQAEWNSTNCQQQIQSCVSNCARIPFVPLATAVTNLGSHIQKLVQNSLSGDMERLLGTDEITELVGIFFSAIMNKAMNGLGLAFKSFTATGTQQARAQNKDKFSYQKQYLKTTNSAEKKDIRSTLYATMEQSINKFTRSIIACESDKMMTVEDFRKNLADILEPNVEAMYVGIQSVNLQPDALVLDPPYAPYPVYGYSWGEVSPSKVPEKCRTVLNQLNMPANSSCSDIISGLEPNYQMTIPAATPLPQCNDRIDNDNDGTIDYPADSGCYSALDNSEITTGGGGGGGFEPEERERVPRLFDLVPGIGQVPCLPCMYDHDALSCPVGPVPPQRYPGEGNTVWTGAVLGQKTAFYQGCAEWYVVALNRCDECLKKYDETCSKLNTEEEKSSCVMRSCNNYEDISTHVIDPPTSALDFYGKCLIEEQKDSCLTCLKEYFIPATYCEQTRDYAARLVTKYPTVLVNKYKKNEGEFRGLFDQSISDMGGLCNDNDHSENISLALICRALPDFAYQGAKVCQTRCNQAGMTEQQLKDVTDFRPDENDCGKLKLPVGGQEPFKAIDDGILDSRGSCCADFWQKNAKNYAICVGAGPATDSTGPVTQTTFSVSLSATPPSGLAPLNGVDLTAVVSGLSSAQNLTYYFDCDNNGTFERTSTSALTALTAAGLCNYPANNTTYTAAVSVMTEFGVSATATTNIQTTDCEITSTLNPANGIAPVAANITGRLNNADPGPFTFTFYCNVPTNGGPVANWDRATDPYTSNTNQYTLNNACNFTLPGTHGIGVLVRGASSTSSCYQTINVSEAPTISCNTDVTAPSRPSINDPITVSTTTSPNSSYTNLINNAVGTTFSYDCHGGNSFTGTQTTQNDFSESSPCSYNFPGTYTINIRVGNTNPANGFTAFGTCQTTVTVQLGFLP
jgi:hypothetical protein